MKFKLNQSFIFNPINEQFFFSLQYVVSRWNNNVHKRTILKGAANETSYANRMFKCTQRILLIFFDFFIIVWAKLKVLTYQRWFIFKHIKANSLYPVIVCKKHVNVFQKLLNYLKWIMKFIIQENGHFLFSTQFI